MIEMPNYTISLPVVSRGGLRLPYAEIWGLSHPVVPGPEINHVT
jgi:hypothetical protein